MSLFCNSTATRYLQYGIQDIFELDILNELHFSSGTIHILLIEQSEVFVVDLAFGISSVCVCVRVCLFVCPFDDYGQTSLTIVMNLK